jgi:FkbM family methyltransferase
MAPASGCALIVVMQAAESIKPNAVNSGRGSGFAGVFPIKLIEKLGPSLFVDVGAAFGEAARGMLEANKEARVIAFEPFQGNLPALHELAAKHPRLNVRAAAVSNCAGRAAFDVPWVVDDAKAAQGFPLGSSVAGKLASGGEHSVETVRLDDEIKEHVRFLKLDIQGGELAALKGSERLIGGPGVDYIYIEFNGSLRVLRLLARHGYILFDSLYLAWPHRFLKRPVPNWAPGLLTLLSTGVMAKRVWPPVPFRGLVLYCLWFAYMRVFVCGLQTDLICVHKSKMPEFLRISQDVRVAMVARKKARRAEAQTTEK